MDILKVGELLYEAHDGASKDYEISCPELDFLVNYTKNFPFILGSRMMGGGFGGCTINLIHKDHLESFVKNVSGSYKDKFNLELTPIDVSISNGASKVT